VRAACRLRVEVAPIDVLAGLDPTGHLGRGREGGQKLRVDPLGADMLVVENIALLEHPLNKAADIGERLFR
jgi:hypothetical protein